MRHRLARPILLALVAVFASTAILMAIRLFNERELALQTYRRGTWVAVQADSELLRLQRALAEYRAEPTPEKLDEVMLRNDLFWSRLPVILDSEEGEGLRKLEGVVEKVGPIAAAMPRLDKLLKSTEPPAVEPILKAEALLDGFSEPLRDIVRRTLIQDNYVYNRERLHDSLLETLAVFGVLLAAGAALILVVLRQDRSTRRLYFGAKRAEADAQKARERLASAIDGASEGILLLDAKDRVLIANRRYRELYPVISQLLEPGTPFQQVIETAAHGSQVASRNPREWAAKRAARLRSPGAPWEQRLSDGRSILVSERRTSDGGLVAVHTDITEVKKNAERLLRLEQTADELAAAIEASDVGVVICDPGPGSTPIRRVNRAFTRLTGYGEEEVLGRDPRFLQTPESDRRQIAVMAKAVSAGEGVRVRLLNHRKDGSSFWNDMTIVPIRARDGSIGSWVGLVVNADDKVQAEEERAELTERFHRAEKMAAVGQLAGGIAHDFNNLLAVVTGFSELLVEALEGPNRDMAERILRAGNRGKGLVEQILAFSRRGDAPRTRAVDLREALPETVQLLRATITHPTELLLEMRADPAVVMADPVQLEQILMNLCINARDALPKGHGYIRIELDSVEIDGGCAGTLRSLVTEGEGRELVRVEEKGGYNRLWLGLLHPGPHLRLRVTDNGSGMELETLRKAFQAFFTTKEAGRGTGLGLATVKSLVTRYGGAIHVVSKPYEGTGVSILFPQLKRSADAVGEQPDARPATVAAVGRILVVDDEPDVLELTVAKLALAGYQTVTATSAEQAVEIFAADPGGFSAVVTDRAMPGSDGLDLAHIISEERPGTPILLCTGYAADLDEATLAAAGVTRLLSKPCDRRTLLDALEQAIEGPAKVS
ncbi:PAS/PAC sensor hybrid histidine kinase [Tistlia consotensis]|uniref:histidine kinase n=1 Tax=Tistlia consotensis USBA 355 TaxID=560819 RepID=A0A1Y6BMF8_9PROT|nr:PAS-domain containing protein [Tistlia consotensis]SMF18983.1 PAS/PAC sensor hybrid histidine kinase [Tistlia consotensis USBA 355]SNR39283.1 PAS/PAC sensor hybrid histidine kinase [Tistlia consotensis]